MSTVLETIIADGNSAPARRARVKLQPRDRKGRWIPTGAAIFGMIQGLDVPEDRKGRSIGGRPGSIKKYSLKAIGGTATSKSEKNKIRALLTKDAPELGLRKNTVIELDPATAELDTQIKLDRDFLKRKGIDPDLQHTLPKGLGEKYNKLEDLNPKPADDLDIELANGGLTDEEDKDFRAERDQEPLAKLPPSMEELSKDELSKLIQTKEEEGPDFSRGTLKLLAKDNYLVRMPDGTLKWTGDGLTYYLADDGHTVVNDHGVRIGWELRQELYSKDMEETRVNELLDDFKDYKLATPEYAKERGFPDGWVGKDKGRNGAEFYELNEDGKFDGRSESVWVSDDADYDFEDAPSWGVNQRGGLALYVDPDLYSFRSSDKDEAIDRAVEYVKKLTTPKSNSEGLSDEMLEKSIALEELFEARSKEAPSDRKITPTPLIDLNVGDVLSRKDKSDLTVTGLSQIKKVKNNETGEVVDAITLSTVDEEGNREDFTFPIDKKFGVVSGKKGKVSRPAKPKDEKDVTPEPPKEEKKPEPEAPREPVIPEGTPNEFPPKDRVDDGGEIVHSPLPEESRAQYIKRKVKALFGVDGSKQKYVDDNGKVRDAYDPFEMMDALAEAYPNAKFTPDGTALIIDRRTDTDGRIFELRASNSGSKALVYTMQWTDPNTGEVEELIHYDKRHSVMAAFRKDNSADALLARLLDGSQLTHGNKSYPSEGLRERAQWFVDKQKMFSPEDLAIKYGVGTENIYHTDKRNAGNLKHRAVDGVWEAFMAYTANPEDPEAIDAVYHRLMGVFGRLPMNELSHKLGRAALRREFKRRYPEVNQRSIGAFITNASRFSLGYTYDSDPDVRSIPHASKDRRTPIEPGMVVEYTNNVGEKTTLKVTKLVENLGIRKEEDGANYDYGDYVYATDADGKQIKLNSIGLRVLKDQNSSLSEYKPNLRGQELRDRRTALGEYGEPGMPDAVPGTETASSDDNMPDIIDDLIPGDSLPNLKDGGIVGEIVSVKPVKGKNGKEGLAFTVVTPDGEEKVVAYELGKEIPKKA